MGMMVVVVFQTASGHPCQAQGGKRAARFKSRETWGKPVSSGLVNDHRAKDLCPWKGSYLRLLYESFWGLLPKNHLDLVFFVLKALA